MANLYSLRNLQSSAGTFQAEVCFDPSHPVFAGHFPGNPVVPGVLLLEILVKAISEVTGKQAVVKEASNLKFLRMIDPQEHGSIMLAFTVVEEADGNYRVNATFRQGELLFAKMTGIRLMSDSFS